MPRTPKLKTDPPTPEEERKWLNKATQWPLDTPDNVLQAMGKIWRGFCAGHIREDTYRLLFAGLKEIRTGREAEASRRTMQDLGVPFTGMLLTPPERSDDNADQGD